MSDIGRNDTSISITALPEMETKLDDLIEKVQAISAVQTDVLGRMSSVETSLEAIKKTPASYYAHGTGAAGGGIGST